MYLLYENKHILLLLNYKKVLRTEEGVEVLTNMHCC